MTDATLAAIHVHPVKSCRSTALAEVVVAETGLADDRLYQVVDASGTPITQRQHRVLATVQPTVLADGLRIEAEGSDPIEVARPTQNDRQVTNLLGLPVEVGDAGDEAAAWFGALLGEPARLVAMTDQTELVVPGFEFRTSLADAAPVLVANEASATWLSDRASEPFGIDRFRPNLTVTGAAAWDEETWRAFTVGGAELGLGLAWPRCAIPQIDQQTAERHKEPAKVLREHRWCGEGTVGDPVLADILEGNGLFGIACTIAVPGTVVRVGDPVVVTERGEPILPPPS
ncbi:MAG: MOSC N-terminal beta barrel domain-containing protein [Actinomycetota bacterium]